MLGTLPEEIAREILYRLPINSLVKCVCVSKTWCSFIKSPGFVSGHLNKTIACNDAVGTHLLVSRLCIRDRNERQGLRENYSLRFDDESLTEYKQLDFPFNGMFNWEEVGRKLLLKLKCTLLMLILGRVLLISLPMAVLEQPQAFVHGAIHFLSYRQFAYFIMVFDLGDEYFHEMALPGSLIHPTMGLPSMTLKEFGDSSVAVIQLESNQLHLWIMKEYGVFESWTKLSSNTWIGISFLETELAFRRNEELLDEDKDGDILALNVTNTRWRKVFNTQCYEGRASFNSYVESLVLIDKGTSTMDISSWDF